MNTRPTVAIINRAALTNNYRVIREKLSPSTSILAVVKANAYGHGAVEVSKTLQSEGCGLFGVAICEEGIELRGNGIDLPIIVLGGCLPEQLPDMIRYKLTPVLFDPDTIRRLDKIAGRHGVIINIHIKIDTGMGRLGFLPDDIYAVFDKISGLKNIRIEGILSHFAEAESQDKEFSIRQLKTFFDILSFVRGRGCNPLWSHMANSSAIVNMPSSHFNLVRPGLMIYGSYPAETLKSKIKLKPALELRTRVVQLKSMRKGSSISYGCTYKTDRDTSVAVLPIGYGDGYVRKLSSLAEVLVRGRRARVVGQICMDMCMVDVGDIVGVTVGDEVVVIGKDGTEDITVEEVAMKAGTISYEILCGIGSRVPRVYI